MRTNINQVLLRRRFVAIPVGESTLLDTTVATVLLGLQELGYTLEVEAVKRLSSLSLEACADWYQEVIKELKELKGDRDYRPMYPNFPKQVMEMSDAALYLNAYFHYFTVWVSDITSDKDIIWLPKYSKKARKPLDEVTPITVLRLAERGKLSEIGRQLVTSNTSISEADKKDLDIIAKHGLLGDPYPDPIPNKENLALIGAYALNQYTSFQFSHYFKTATDVLRLAAAFSGGDVSLAEPTKFVISRRKIRRQFLELLDRCTPGSFGQLLEDMNRFKIRWIRLGEQLHPGEFKDRFPRAYSAFVRIRSGENIPTFYTLVERNLRSKNIVAATKLLAERPGELARRLGHLIRVQSDEYPKVVLDEFREVAHKVSTPVLLQVFAHFQNTNLYSRLVFPKGNIAKTRVIPGIPPIDPGIGKRIASICHGALMERFGKLPRLGKVFVDPVLKNYLVPFSQRSASKSLRPLVRGSKIPFGDKNTIRFFLWWKDLEDGSRVDVDLSACLYDRLWNMVERIAYTNLRYGYKGSGYFVVHSGDITSAPNGACEFIDLDIRSVLKCKLTDTRYVVMCVNSFTHQKFSDIPDCRAGWMLREKPGSGEIFDARTVTDQFSLSCAATFSVPMIIDLVDRNVIWMDAALKPGESFPNNVDRNMDQIKLIGKAFSEIQKPNLYFLFCTHAFSRGTFVESPERADTCFGLVDGLPAVNGEILSFEKITSEYTANGAPVKEQVLV